MILIFGFGIIYLTGILAGFLFILSFLGCCSHINSKICNFMAIKFLQKNHKKIIYSALIMALIHASLAVLSRFGLII
ncbi:hypothetical protein HYW76_03300 [Candidatus Pacearchaeota archaeon]|nr:hypothetical protein [Candidatus Pacearchaeota archaeon]